MIIAVNTISPEKKTTTIRGNFIYESFRRIAEQVPQNTFIFIFDRLYDHGLDRFENVIPEIIDPPIHRWLRKFWYNHKIRAVLKKYKADVFVTSNGWPIRTKIPQCLVIADHLQIFKSSNHQISKSPNHQISKSSNHQISKSSNHQIKKAAVIITVSEFCKKIILENYGVDENRIHIVFSGVDEIFVAVDLDEKLKVKEQYAGGNEYFLMKGENYLRQNVLNLLKAFSVFKKRLKSNMQLMVIIHDEEKRDEFKNALLHYKYNKDVHLPASISMEELARLTASAYAMVYPVYFDCTGIPLLESMRSGVPVIASDMTPLHEICKDAALYIDPHNYTDIADKMLLIFKDERLRHELIGKGKHRAEKYKWEKAAELVWSAIVKTIGNGQ